MSVVALISCTSKKNNTQCLAKDMYMPSLRFKLSYEYANSVIKADKIFILSAKYGLLELNEVIDTYNLSLKDMSKSECLLWANRVEERLKILCDTVKDKFVILAGKPYYKYLLPKLNDYVLPLEGMPIGKGNSYLKGEINSVRK